jgi:hypothetical protein
MIPTKKSRATERGELMKYFRAELNRGRVRDGLLPLTMPRMGKIFEAIPTKDLYFLKSVCDQHAERGGDFSKRFWWEIDPKKHTKEAIAKRVLFKNSTKRTR